MAKLSAHGREIGRIQYTTQMRAYMSDSAVLVNYGSGWKIKGKLKAGLTPESAFKAAQEKQAAIMLNNPAWRDYTKELYSLGGIALTPRLHMTIRAFAGRLRRRLVGVLRRLWGQRPRRH